MNIRQKLASVLLVIFSLLAIQAQAQNALQGAQLTAYQTLSTALGNNATENEAADELAVQAARAAGLSDESIAGAMQENGRSAAQQAAALLPANPTQAQVTAATGAIVNSTNAQGSSNSTSNAVSVQTTISAVLINSGVDTVTAVNLASTAASNTNSAAGGTPTPGLAGTINTLPATASGLAPTFTAATSTLTSTGSSSGPNIEEAAVITETAIIPVSTTQSLDEPDVIVPETTTLHVF